jgi:hypothetical protein
VGKRGVVAVDDTGDDDDCVADEVVVVGVI